MAAQPLHFVLVPLLAPGHVIPVLDLARLIAGRGGARVTVVLTPVTAARNRAVLEHALREGLAVDVAELRFPGPALGLPEGCESHDMVTELSHFTHFYQAVWLLAGPLETYLRALPRRPDCLVADTCNPWTADVARRLDIPRFVFHGPSAFFLLSQQSLAKHGVHETDSVAGDFEQFVVPDFPDSSRARPRRLGSSIFLGWRSKGATHCTPRPPPTASSSTRARPSRARTSRDTERRSTGRCGPSDRSAFWTPTRRRRPEEATARPSTPARSPPGSTRGRTSPCSTSASAAWPASYRRRPRSSPPAWSRQIARSSGSLGRPTASTPGSRSAWRAAAWSSVGGFLTYCGWNSTLESLSHGVPLLTWPHIADQFLNETLVVDVLGAGVRVGIKVPAMHVFMNPELYAKQVGRDDIKKALTELMDEGSGIRTAAKKLATMAREAMAEGGSSDRDVADMVRHVGDLVQRKEKGVPELGKKMRRQMVKSKIPV